MEHSGILYQQFTYHVNAAGMPTNTADTPANAAEKKANAAEMTANGPDTPTNTADTPADAPQKPALIIYLHGRSGSGKDNRKQLESPAVDSIVNYIRKKHMHAYLIAPQCPTTHEWVSSQRSPVRSFHGRAGHLVPCKESPGYHCCCFHSICKTVHGPPGGLHRSSSLRNGWR